MMIRKLIYLLAKLSLTGQNSPVIVLLGDGMADLLTEQAMFANDIPVRFAPRLFSADFNNDGTQTYLHPILEKMSHHSRRTK